MNSKHDNRIIQFIRRNIGRIRRDEDESDVTCETLRNPLRAQHRQQTENKKQKQTKRRKHIHIIRRRIIRQTTRRRRNNTNTTKTLYE